jgi:hypothetical protein
VAGKDGVLESGMTASKVEREPVYYRQLDGEAGSGTGVIARRRVVQQRAASLITREWLWQPPTADRQ